MIRIKFKTFVPALAVIALATLSTPTRADGFIKENISFAAAQTELMLQAVGTPTGKNYPRTMRPDGTLGTTGIHEWTSGFFPGSLWYLYELTGDEKWNDEAEKWTVPLAPLRTHTGTHDLGFMVYCSYGNAERLDPRPVYKDILVESAASLVSRFSEKTGVIRSWDWNGRAWDGETTWQYPVIIDNMMNLELLFYASKVTGDKKYYDTAVKHADTTLKNHFRDDGTTYHVVDYDPETGAVRGRVTHQGYSDNSMWARGQAWAIYGYAMTYRETRDPKYLDVAVKAADVFLAGLPGDLVPLWDFNTGQQGYTPGTRSHAVQFRGETQPDASAAAIVCSALFELGVLAGKPGYIDIAVKMLHSLASPAYRAGLGENSNFVLKHCVGSIPGNSEIDKPLVYADYYFLEALVRYRKHFDLTRMSADSSGKP